MSYLKATYYVTVERNRYSGLDGLANRVRGWPWVRRGEIRRPAPPPEDEKREEVKDSVDRCDLCGGQLQPGHTTLEISWGEAN